MSAVPEDAAGRFTVGIVVAKRKLSNPWADHAWLPAAALPAAPDMAPWTRLSANEREELFFAGSYELSFHRGETSHYRDNLVSGHPSLWVSLRPVGGDQHEIAAVTADPYEGESMAGAIGEIVEAVPMPPEVQAHLAAFVEAFHVERAFFKRKNKRADAEALARGVLGQGRRRDET
jgi:hypothetical protein